MDETESARGQGGCKAVVRSVSGGYWKGESVSIEQLVVIVFVSGAVTFLALCLGFVLCLALLVRELNRILNSKA